MMGLPSLRTIDRILATKNPNRTNSIPNLCDTYYGEMRREALAAISHVKTVFSLSTLEEALESDELYTVLLQVQNLLKQEFQNRLYPYVRRCHKAGLIYARMLIDAEEEISENVLDVYNTTYTTNRMTALGSLLIKDEITSKQDRLREETDLSSSMIAFLMWSMIGLHSSDAKFLYHRAEELWEEGISEHRLKIRLERMTQALNRNRAHMIANTESNMAVNTGAESVWTYAAKQGIIPTSVKKQWNVVWDEALCPLCEPLADAISPIGKFTWSLDGHIIDEGSAIPKHPRCRCYYTLVM